MPRTKSVIEAIYFNPLKNGANEYGSTHTARLRMSDGKYYQAGFTKGEVLRGKMEDSDKYVTLTVGSEIEFKYQESEYQGKPQYKTQSSKIEVIMLASPSETNNHVPSGSTEQGSTQSQVSGGVNPAAVGMAFNNAVALLIAEKGDLSEKSISAKTKELFHLVEGIKDELNGKTKTSAPKKKEEPAPAARPKKEKPSAPASEEEFEDFDDDFDLG